MKRLVAVFFILFGFGFAILRIVPLVHEMNDRRDVPNRGERPGPPDGRRFRGPPGPGGRGSRGPGGGVQEPTGLVERFDKNADNWLNAEERKAAREFLETERAEGRGQRGPASRPRNQNLEPPQPGLKVEPADVPNFPEKGLYEMEVVRTLFLEFENGEWEKELSDFYRTDVEVPAKLTLDGKTYSGVGVHFRGASSFFRVEPGHKHSLSLSTDFIQNDQNLYGYRSLNLLNAHTDPTFLRTVLYLQAARDYIPAPKANYLRVVINGESWGMYVNAQQFNKEFVNEWFGTTKGARWKVPGSPRARGGLEYLGEDPAEYQKIYEIKTKDSKKSWNELIKLCRTLNQTPQETLEQELSAILDIDGALKFLALENALINSDGYWIRTSDYDLYQDEKGRFHVIPHDANETFRAPDGPGSRDEGQEGVNLDPLKGSDDPSKPLLNKLLAVPGLRAKYLGYIRDIAEKWLDWAKIGPIAEKYQAMIAADVKSDTRKLYSYEAFSKGVVQEMGEEVRDSRQTASLKAFAEQRRKFLLNHPAVKAAAP